MKVLVTGGTGFVGWHLARELEKEGIEFVLFSRKDLDLTYREETLAFFGKHRDSDAVIHLASFHAGGTFPQENPGSQFMVNSRMHLNVLEAWKEKMPGAKLIAVGSSCAYPDREPPYEEDMYMEGAIHGSVYAYAFTKRLLFTGIKALGDQFGLNGNFLIPATMYGEHDDFSEETAHVCGALIGRFVKAGKTGMEKVEVWGDGEQERDFMDVKEFVRVLVRLIPRLERETLNIGPGKPTRIKDLAFMIAEAAGYEGEIYFNREKYTGVKRKYISSRKLNEKYGLKVSSDHFAGIKRTTDWYSKTFESLKNKKKFE